MILLVMFSMLAIVLLEVPRLIKNKLWRELGAFFFILTLAYALALAEMLDLF